MKNKAKITVLLIILLLLLIIVSYFYTQVLWSSLSFDNPLSMILVALAIAIGACLFLISRLLPKDKAKFIFWTKFLGLWNIIGGAIIEIVIIVIKLLVNQ